MLVKPKPKMTDREIAARLLYEKDLDLNDSTTVKDIIDLMVSYGEIIEKRAYQKGLEDRKLCETLPKNLR